MSRAPIGWDHPDTLRFYRRFQRHHQRYQRANRELVRAAEIGPGMRVLDVAAGDGGTARAALAKLGPRGTLVCFEPAAAMREGGRRQLDDPRVEWTNDWPTASSCFDRVLCGAAVWQLEPLPRAFRKIHGLLRRAGRFCFDVPALYLGESDPPGGGRDPWLLELPAALASEAASAKLLPSSAPGAGGGPSALDRFSLETMLDAAGFDARRWQFAYRFRQPAYREWLKIPPTTDRLLLGLGAEERARLIDRAYERVDAGSWRKEQWLGWTAIRRG